MASAKEVKIKEVDGDPMPERNVEMLKELIGKVAWWKLIREHAPVKKEAA
jgi:hypothetical protein